MTKELEALNKVKKFKDDCCMFGSSDIEIDRELDIIETALKRLENYEKNEDFSKDVINYAFLSEKEKTIKNSKHLKSLKKT